MNLSKRVEPEGSMKIMRQGDIIIYLDQWRSVRGQKPVLAAGLVIGGADGHPIHTAVYVFVTPADQSATIVKVRKKLVVMNCGSTSFPKWGVTATEGAKQYALTMPAIPGPVAINDFDGELEDYADAWRISEDLRKKREVAAGGVAIMPLDEEVIEKMYNVPKWERI